MCVWRLRLNGVRWNKNASERKTKSKDHHTVATVAKFHKIKRLSIKQEFRECIIYFIAAQWKYIDYILKSLFPLIFSV